MQERATPSDVIPLRPALVHRSGGAAAIARALDAEFVKTLNASLDAALQATDDYLFNLADKAGSSSQQNSHFDSMRMLRLHRQSINQLFSTRIQTSLEQLFVGRLPAAPGATSAARVEDRMELSLVEHDALEENLAVDSLIDRCQQAFSRHLHALTRRIAQALSVETINDDNNPVAPRQLANSASHALTPAELPVDVRLIFFKHLERQWLGALGPLYDRANRLLAESGVLPELRYQASRGGAPAPMRPRPAGADAQAPAIETDTAQAAAHQGYTDYSADPAYGGVDQQLAPVLSELMRLLGGYSAPHSQPVANATGPAPVGQGPAIDSHALMNALSMLQAEHMAAGPEGVLTPAQTRALVLNRARGMVGGDSLSQPRHLEENALNLVGMLFEYAIEDRNLPAELKALISRLQIPYLKVALIDPTFVARRDHPARALLDDLATAALGWSADSDRDKGMYQAIESLVREVIANFDQDVGVFEQARAELNEALAGQRKRSELAERRTAETARGRERLEHAQQQAARELLRRVEGKPMPDRLRDLLTKRWSNYLVMTHLRNGDDSNQWNDALRVVEVLADAPSRIAADKDGGRALIEVEQILKRGLAAVGIHDEDVDELWSGIAELLASPDASLLAAAGPAQPDKLAGPMASHSSNAIVPASRPETAARTLTGDDLEVHFTTGRDEVVIKPQTLDSVAAAEAAASAEPTLDAVRQLKPGAWVEFVGEADARERLKLLWVSAVRSQYLFVNRNGIKSGEYSATELAALIRGGRAQILEESGLVDRALNAIVRKLRGSKANT
ncbi:MAG: DUF1631 domain-containing protein [Lysobacterales bacterium]